MKKQIAVLTAAVLAAAAVAGCSSKQAETPSTEAPSATEASTEASAEEMNADIVIVGASGAGFAAALQAVEEGIPAENILILEKGETSSGSALSVMAGMNAADSAYQQNAGIEDDVEVYAADINAAGDNLGDPELVNYLSESAKESLEWLSGMGLELSMISQDSGSTLPRTHRPSDDRSAGEAVMSLLESKVEELKIPVMYEVETSEILLDEDGEVAGVMAVTSGGEQKINCQAVVLAGGGFGANQSMVAEYIPDLAEVKSVSDATATGACIALGQAAGAVVTNMDQAELYPLVETQSGTLISQDLYRAGAILVNNAGERFVDETQVGNKIAKTMLEQPEGYAYLIYDGVVKERESLTDDYESAGLAKQGATAEELAEAIGVPADALAATLGGVMGEGPYYAIRCEPAILTTLGGLQITNCAEVMNEEEIIPGLFAAGDVAGGIHGSSILDGDYVTAMLVFGRTAGTEAAGVVD